MNMETASTHAQIEKYLPQWRPNTEIKERPKKQKLLDKFKQAPYIFENTKNIEKSDKTEHALKLENICNSFTTGSEEREREIMSKTKEYIDMGDKKFLDEGYSDFPPLYDCTQVTPERAKAAGDNDKRVVLKNNAISFLWSDTSK